jgi:hypothetical protein
LVPWRFACPSAWKFTLAMRFIHGMGLREMLGNKGFGGLSILFDKYIFKLLAFFIGNIPYVI